MNTIYTDRSRIETAQRCLRLRFLSYHQDGIGIEPASKPLPLALGGAFHVGAENLLLGRAEDEAVAAAIADLGRYRGKLALDGIEAIELAKTAARPPAKDAEESLADQLQATADSLGLALDDPLLADLHYHSPSRSGAQQFDDYLWQEQSALVEGLVRAYARRRLRPLLEEFEVLEVEREGTWKLGQRVYEEHVAGASHTTHGSIVFCSRPDALLRSRLDHGLYLLSFKTAASWDYRKEKDAQHDAQGLSEGIDVERRLGERVVGIRYEYILKGERWRDRDLSARFGLDVRSQKSHLLRAYECVSQPKTSRAGIIPELGAQCWSYDFLKEDGSEGSLAWQNWKPRMVTDRMTIRDWIDLLDGSEEQMSAYDSTVGMEPRAMGWRSAAQAVGLTKQHPLDAIFVPPITVYRSDDDLRDWLEQTEAQEVRIAEGVAEVAAAVDDDERRSALNLHFPQSRKQCSYPSECAFVGVCYGGEDIRRDPLASGKFVRRVPNHAAEKEAAR